MVRHIAKVSEEQVDFVPQPIRTINAIPSSRVREAASLLELAYTCTSSFPELTSLYYDQLTSMCMTNNKFDKYFMTWLYLIIDNGFEDSYIVNTIPTCTNDIELKMEYMINE